MLTLICKFLAWLPLPCIHRLGAWLARIWLFFNRKASQIAQHNIKQSGLVQGAMQVATLEHLSRLEAGKALLETFYIWGQSQEKLLPLVKRVHGQTMVDEALKAGKGLIFLTPHLGCFEISSIYYAAQQPITVLYRPPKLKILQGVMLSGRQKGLVDLAPANAAGVKKLLQALKRGEAIGILPDQIPKQGEGEWAPFFGKPAYTMSLASKLAVKSGAVVIMAFAERLPNGEGFEIHLQRVDDISTTSLLNQAIEQQIAQCPAQYLWQYDRHKQRYYAMQKKATS